MALYPTSHQTRQPSPEGQPTATLPVGAGEVRESLLLEVLDYRPIEPAVPGVSSA